jgi:2-dehydro-3-deoxyphosphooctonate aldolase (KDO 8-P synthase)
MKTVQVGNISIGEGHGLVLIAGPCVIESRDACLEIAGKLAELAKEESIPFIFKASYDKANRSSHLSFRGPGIDEGLEVLAEVKDKFAVPVLTDVHGVDDVGKVADVVDVIQIPAFLSRQTDLILAAAETGKVVNVKKGQFMAPNDAKNIVAKVQSSGNDNLTITERGCSFGYNDLVVDMRGIPVIRGMGCPVIFDATHSVQSPGGAGDRSGGDRTMVPCLAKAAVAAGCDGVFLETYLSPDDALCDSANAMAFSDLRDLWCTLRAIHEAVE